MALTGRAIVVWLCTLLVVVAGGVSSAAGAVVGVVAAWQLVLVSSARRRRGRVTVVVDTALIVTASLALPHLAARGGAVGAGDWVAFVTSMTAMAAPWYAGVGPGVGVVLFLAAAAAAGGPPAAPVEWRVGQEHAVWLLWQGLLSCALAVLVGRRARHVDRLAAAVAEARRGAQLEDARRAALEEHMAVLHDTVASTLTTAAADGVGGAALASQASADVSQLAEAGLLGRDAPGSGDAGGDAPEAWQRSWLHDLGRAPRGSRLRVELKVSGFDDAPGPEADPRPPVRTRRALVAATAEALRNVERHAGSGRAEVAVRPIGERGIAVDVIDHGIGFLPDHVSHLRYGLRLSIARRMRFAGGTARVRSSPGSGTTVELRWPARGAGG